MLTAIDILQRVGGGAVPEILEVRDLVESRDLSGLLKNLDKVYNVWRDQNNLGEDERRNIYEATSYFSGLEYSLIRVAKRYLEHERDVISSAESSAPTGEQTVMGEARKEIEGKIQELETTLSNPQDLFRKFTDSNWVQSFVSLNCYHQ